MSDDTEARDPGCEQAGDAISNREIDPGKPALAEAHH
jgi:hypothetical protein